MIYIEILGNFATTGIIHHRNHVGPQHDFFDDFVIDFLVNIKCV